ncbi:hypothetical protein LJC47_02900 [Desulfosarcina sp. OttesenSCG-928-B08]|nr:hypothetical protein [Desulfosarcina sp. OttesenSCG-928-B08]
MWVSLSEFKADPEKYVEMAGKEELYSAKNGKQVTRLTRAAMAGSFP